MSVQTFTTGCTLIKQKTKPALEKMELQSISFSQLFLK